MREIFLTETSPRLKVLFELRRDIDAALKHFARGKVVELNDLADRLGDPEHGTPAWALANALKALDRAQRWEPALAAAEAQPERFRDSARYLAGQTVATAALGDYSAGLREALGILANLNDFDDPARAAAALRRAPITTPVTNIFETPKFGGLRPDKGKRDADPVVHLRFDVDDKPVAWPLAVQANRAYQLSVIAHPDVWPDSADKLVINLVGVPSSLLSVSPIEIPHGNDKGVTWLVSQAEIAMDHAAELTAVATFTSGELEQPARVVGHQKLRVTTLDPNLSTGQPFVAQKIVEMLGDLSARIPNLPIQDWKDIVAMLDATSIFASLATERDDLVGIDERMFQKKLKQGLRQDVRIGAALQEGTDVGGGEVDLVLRRLNDELKVSHSPVDLDDVELLVGQPTQYGSGMDSPIGMLTVLDDSPKDRPPSIPANNMKWVYPKTDSSGSGSVPSMVAVVVIRTNYRKPHEWTKTPIADEAEVPEAVNPETASDD